MKAKQGGGMGMPVGSHVVLKEWSEFEQNQKEVTLQTM